MPKPHFPLDKLPVYPYYSVMDVLSLERARLLAGLNQRDLDRLAGLAKGTIHEIENKRNKRPAYETVVRIVRALQRAGLKGITAEEIFPVADVPAPDQQSQVA